MEVQSFRPNSKAWKIAILFLGAIVLGIGYHSHIQSSWCDFYPGSPTHMRFYELCNAKPLERFTCPSIAIEIFFILVVSVCFLLSLFGFCLGFQVDTDSTFSKSLDACFHHASAIGLFTVSIMYMISAQQIQNYIDASNLVKEEELQKQQLNFRTTEKVYTGVLTILLSSLYQLAAGDLRK